MFRIPAFWFVPPSAFQRVRGFGSRSFSAVAAPANARSRHSVSLAIETFVSRATSSSGSPRNEDVPALDCVRYLLDGL